MMVLCNTSALIFVNFHQVLIPIFEGYNIVFYRISINNPVNIIIFVIYWYQNRIKNTIKNKYESIPLINL